MSAGHFVKLVILLVLIAGAGTILLWNDWNENEEASAGSGGRMFPSFPLDRVDAVRIEDDQEKVELKKGETWMVASRWNYPADHAKLSQLLQDVWDLKKVRSMPVGPTQLGRLELLAPGEEDGSGTQLDFLDAQGELLASLRLGKDHEPRSGAPGPSMSQGRYAMEGGDPKKVALVDQTFSMLSSDPSQWLDKSGFLEVDKLRSVSVAHPEEAGSWSVARESESGDMEMADLPEGMELDSTRSYSLKNILNYPTVSDVADPDAPEADLGLDRAIEARLSTFEDFQYTVRIGEAQEDDLYPLTVEASATIVQEREAEEGESEEDKQSLDEEFAEEKERLEAKLEKESALEGWIFLVPKYSVDTLLLTRSELLKEKEAEEETEGASAPAPPSSDEEEDEPSASLSPQEASDLIRTLTDPLGKAVEDSGTD